MTDANNGSIEEETNGDQHSTRYEDGSVKLRNQHIELMDQDILYHLALGSGSHDLVEMFGDVKFVCMGGTPKRMEQFAYYIMGEIGHKLPAGTMLQDISQYSYRYCMYKVGPVLSVSHGMGLPSVAILLHEIIKLMYHAKVRDPVFFRMGTSGGIGLEGGTVVISEQAVDGLMRPCYELDTLSRGSMAKKRDVTYEPLLNSMEPPSEDEIEIALRKVKNGKASDVGGIQSECGEEELVMSKLIQRPAKLDKKLVKELKALSHADDPYDTITGKTLCTSDFYEGQGRLDGAFCEFSENDKMVFLEKIHKAGVVNMEMESLAFAALTHHAGIRSAVICATIVDRLKGDQIHAPKEVLDEWQERPQKLVSRYIKKYLQTKGRFMDSYCGSPCVKSPRRFKLVQQESENYD